MPSSARLGELGIRIQCRSWRPHTAAFPHRHLLAGNGALSAGNGLHIMMFMQILPADRFRPLKNTLAIVALGSNPSLFMFSTLVEVPSNAVFGVCGPCASRVMLKDSFIRYRGRHRHAMRAAHG
jgi:hypothetical protein